MVGQELGGKNTLETGKSINMAIAQPVKVGISLWTGKPITSKNILFFLAYTSGIPGQSQYHMELNGPRLIRIWGRGGALLGDNPYHRGLTLLHAQTLTRDRWFKNILF